MHYLVLMKFVDADTHISGDLLFSFLIKTVPLFAVLLHANTEWLAEFGQHYSAIVVKVEVKLPPQLVKLRADFQGRCQLTQRHFS